MIRGLIRDVAGSAPYEKRLVELLKNGRDKRALKLAKRKVSARGLGLSRSPRNLSSRSRSVAWSSRGTSFAPEISKIDDDRDTRINPSNPFFAPSQLGTHLRAKKKREEMGNLMRKSSRKPAAEAK